MTSNRFLSTFGESHPEVEAEIGCVFTQGAWTLLSPGSKRSL